MGFALELYGPTHSVADGYRSDEDSVGQTATFRIPNPALSDLDGDSTEDEYS